MHFEILVEDQSGKKALDQIVPRILVSDHSYRILPYKGLGRLPKDMRPKSRASKRVLLDQLPRLLKGYGSVPDYAGRFIVVICDLDDNNKDSFLQELNDVLEACNPKPEACFCLAIEELEAWYLGDLPAVLESYPNAKNSVLNSYSNDSICGTWELLADAVYKGGSKELKKRGTQAIGLQKNVWADIIATKMDVENNESPSFRYFRDKLRNIASSSINAG